MGEEDTRDDDQPSLKGCQSGRATSLSTKFNPLRASAGDRAQPLAPNAPWRQSSAIGPLARLRDPNHVDQSR